MRKRVGDGACGARSAGGRPACRRDIYRLWQRQQAAAFHWSLFDGGYTFATKIAAPAYEFNNQYKAGAYIAADLMLFLLRLVVNATARQAVSGRAGR